MTIQIFDPRAIGDEVYGILTRLRAPYDEAENAARQPDEKKIYRDHLKEQKNQAVELYTYLSTWGLMRLKAEEMALDKSKPNEKEMTVKKKAEKKQEGKREIIQQFFYCLQTLWEGTSIAESGGTSIADRDGLKALTRENLKPESYLALTGLGLAIAREFGFWANAVYHDVSGEE